MESNWQQHDERYFASDVAELFLASMGEDEPSEIERVEGIVFMAGQHLAEQGRHGLWARFTPQEFFRRLHGTTHFRVGVALTLMSVFTVLGYNGWIDPQRANELVAQLCAAAPESEILDELERSSRDALSCEMN